MDTQVLTETDIGCNGVGVLIKICTTRPEHNVVRALTAPLQVVEPQYKQGTILHTFLHRFG